MFRATFLAGPADFPRLAHKASGSAVLGALALMVHRRLHRYKVGPVTWSCFGWHPYVIHLTDATYPGWLADNKPRALTIVSLQHQPRARALLYLMSLLSLMVQ